MGVTGLWTVVAPTARPTQLATLNRKRLAVDASIWIYQFLKAVRDKEGKALRNSHVVGFFRRICKLLYFGIKPVFVFDGGAPILKRETVRSRARRREGRREDAARTAGKLLAVQVARAAEEEEKRRRADRERTPVEEELPPDQELVYVDELGMTQKERESGRGFKRKDQYHLPDLDVSIESMGAPNDPRIMSQAELEEYARQFHSGEDINLYDFSKIDFESPFFLSLPPGDRYNILNAARLRSRLRMGYSKEQLDGMFPDRMAFSKFQIERVKERNELTQRLMHVNGMAEDFLNQGGRIAGEKGKEYVLVKNDGVEGGWALGVVSNKQGSRRDNAIDLEDEDNSEDGGAETGEEEDFEDVAIEGLNRVPKTWQRKRREGDDDISYEDAATQIARKRKAVYDARKAATQAHPPPRPTPVAQNEMGSDSLFVAQDQDQVDDEEEDDLFEDVDLEKRSLDEEDDDLKRAIAMSLEHPDDDGTAGGFLEAHGSKTSTTTKGEGNKDMEDELDLQTALAKSRASKPATSTVDPKSATAAFNLPKFDGPLPFESLNLGQSLLGKKKAQKVEQDLSGGFDRDLGDDAFRKERPAQPLPSWFEAAPKTNDLRQPRVEENEENEESAMPVMDEAFREKVLRREASKEIIDVDAEDVDEEAIDISSDEDHTAQPFLASQDTTREALDWEMTDTIVDETDPKEEARKKREEEAREERYRLAREIAAENDTQSSSGHEAAEGGQAKPIQPEDLEVTTPTRVSPAPEATADMEPESDEVDWSESDHDPKDAENASVTSSDHTEDRNFETEEIPNGRNQKQDSEGEDMEFEDVDMDKPPPLLQQSSTADLLNQSSEHFLLPDDEDIPSAASSAAKAQNPDAEFDEFDEFSDSDEELMRQLAVEAEEHARFASSLNNTRTPAQAARDYETELKQLRNQQKKDRRDADEVTQAMVQECQALLRLFGLPYITAPMEAEAQCAELVHLGLVDGIVTDDSDIFLFGGTRIYKNMFNAAKFVECYLASDLEKEYALDRRKLIRFAHLLGSDYTEGIPGVGPVTALEILTDFATLEEFREWCNKVQLGRPQDLENQLITPFRRKFRNTAQKRLFLPPGFPDLRVDEAYLKPDVDSDPEEFQWGVPDLDKLRSFLMATIGWSQDRTDEILVPVIRDMNKRETEGTQANITRFFAGGVGIGAAPAAASVASSSKEGTAPRNRTGKESGRMAKAFTRLRGEAERKRRGEDAVVEEELPQEEEDIGQNEANGDNDNDDNMEDVTSAKAPKTSRRTKTPKKRKPTKKKQVFEDEEVADDETYEPSTKRKKVGKSAARDSDEMNT